MFLIKQVSSDLGITPQAIYKQKEELQNKGYMIKNSSNDWEITSDGYNYLKEKQINRFKRNNTSLKEVSPPGGHVPKPIEPKAIELANLMYELHKQVDPKLKSPNIEKWAADIEKINRLDGRSYEDIEKVIRWIKTPGNFWFANIMSGNKLRLQFSRLYIEACKNIKKGYKPVMQNDVYKGNGEDW